jgi:hypothetical protein
VYTNTIRLHRELFQWTKCTKENEWILLILVLLHLFLYSHNFLSQIKSSSSTDSLAKSRPRGSGLFIPTQMCWIMRPGYSITKNTMKTYLQLPNTPFLGQDYLKCRENIYRLTITCIYLTKAAACLNSQVCLDMCTQSKITRDVTWSCISTYGQKYSPLHQRNKLIWNLG